MAQKLNLSFDENLVAELSNKFDLRAPNAEALADLVKRIEEGNYDALEPLVLNLATGAGKTYVMAAFIEYLRRQGHPNVMVVTPTKVVQDKTVLDFSEGSHRYIGGFDVPPRLVTPGDVSKLRIDNVASDLFVGEGASTLYVFNVQQLFPPKDGGKNVATGDEAARRKTWKFQEDSGALAQRLIDTEDLVIIADESHLFGSTAKTFRKSLTSLKPAVTVGLTASPDKGDDVVYRYPLWRAIQDGYVKQPVLVYRESGYDSEDRQLQDALSLLAIKEEAYANYRAAHPNGKQTKPLLFVVCSGVPHATEVAERLRGPGFVGDPLAVLQVDNEHNDNTTQSFLRYLDTDNSPVRVIVSVNKLREGWDTKRIAVMCTLRTMGSEVLTQQVMGRGLRLPFGALTGVPAIDELDILSHESFVKLLQSENVLKQFGIEDAVRDGDGTEIITPPGTTNPPQVVTGTGTGGSTSIGTGATGTMTVQPGESSFTSNEVIVTPSERTVGTRALTDEDDVAKGVEIFTPVVVHVNEKFAGTTFDFPSSAMTKTKKQFELVDIPNSVIVERADKVTDTDEYLARTKIGVANEGNKIELDNDDRSAVPSFKQTPSQVAAELIRRVMGSGAVAATVENTSQLKRRIVPAFMEATKIEQWTEKAKESAARHLRELVVEESRKANAQTGTTVSIHPVTLPIDNSFVLDLDKKVLDLLDRQEKSAGKAGFSTAEYYGTWKKGLFEAARFDSFTGEYRLAALLDLDPNVVWWKRIYAHEGARVAYTPHNSYVPDFVVFDKDGTHWIVEAKENRGRDDERVQAKRAAAERVVRQLVGMPEYEDQTWGYLIAYEDDIASSDSWADLVAVSLTERMPKL
ncbi:DEAD/DEAH box helicase family protein [Corynebacterium riegelii]|uniref:DEAD/DEAH box helicase family protein n=1 Tax=Corynebacterium riegelii TaxID=156976 RepID=UPI002550CBB7|nr:DEAD/DEAH box helicase family protein [Corynebacterium riegelii]MDK7180311.1 DEAD/DEAH box helicase family protein [Corynebacterium riegelii]